MSAYFDDHEPPGGLGPRSVRGGALAISARAVSGLIQLGSVLVLARLLTPEDYGIVAMVTAVTGFAPVLVDLGTRDAISQRLRISAGEVSALFWITVTVGSACSLLFSASGPLLALFYGQPSLTAITSVSSLTFVFAALVSQHQALLRRALKFRELAISEIAANMLSTGAAIAMALSGLHYWALVTRPVALHGFMAVAVWLYCRWLPARPTLTSGVRNMVKFGLHLTGFSLTDYSARNGDRVAIGRALGAQTLGYYQTSTLFYDHLLGVLVLPLYPIAIATLSKLQGELGELRKSWARAISTLTFYAMPAFGLLAVVSRDLVVALLGPKWADASVLLSVLALRGIPHSAERTLGWLHVCAGRTDRWFRWGVVAACGQFLALFLGLPFGTTGVVWAYVLFMYLAFIPALAYAGRPLGIGARDVLRAVGAQFTGALGAAGLGFAVQTLLPTSVSPLERMTMLALVYLTGYLTIVIGLFRQTTPAQVCLAFLGDVLPTPLKPLANLSLARPRE